jgi:hypothetical protein
MATKKLYRIRFQNEAKVFELYARQVTQGELFGFIQVEQLEWGKKSALIIDPTEQELRNEFAGVKRFQIPMHAVVRIDEVEKPGTAKIVAMAEAAKKPAAAPLPTYPPTPGPRSR